MAVADQEAAVQTEEEIQDESAQAGASAAAADKNVQSSEESEHVADEHAADESGERDAQRVTETRDEDATTETAKASRTERRKEQLASEIKELLEERATLRGEMENLRGPVAAALRGTPQKSDKPAEPVKSPAVLQFEQAGQALQQAAQNGIATDSQEYARLYQRYDECKMSVVQERAVEQSVQKIKSEQAQAHEFEQNVNHVSQTLARINSKFPFLKPPVNGQVTFDMDAPLVKVAQQLAQERGMNGQITALQQVELLKDAALELATSDSTLAKAAIKQTQNKAQKLATRTGLETAGAGGGGQTTPSNRLTSLHKAALTTPDGSEAWDAYFEEKIRLGEKSR